MTMHLVVGAGPVGCTTASMLADAGDDVRIVTRDGGGPDHRFVERSESTPRIATRMRRAAADATVLYNAASPPYHRWVSDWPPLAASLLSVARSRRGGAGHGQQSVRVRAHPCIHGRDRSARRNHREGSCPRHESGRTRSRLIRTAACARHELRSSDYFGPRVLTSQLGDRTIPKILAGKTVSVFGDPDVPHSWSYITDVARTLVVLGTEERAWGRAWHTPTNPACSATPSHHRVERRRRGCRRVKVRSSRRSHSRHSVSSCPTSASSTRSATSSTLRSSSIPRPRRPPSGSRATPMDEALAGLSRGTATARAQWTTRMAVSTRPPLPASTNSLTSTRATRSDRVLGHRSDRKAHDGRSQSGARRQDRAHPSDHAVRWRCSRPLPRRAHRRDHANALLQAPPTPDAT